MKPIAWYDPSNGMVSTDQDCSLFTPLGQVWPLYPEREWVGLTDEELDDCYDNVEWNTIDWCPDHRQLAKAVEAKLKEKNT
jgi:hypothetical protein